MDLDYSFLLLNEHLAKLKAKIPYPWHLAGYEAAVSLSKVGEPEAHREALLSDVYGLQHARVTQLLQHTRHVQLEGGLLSVGLDAAHKPGIASVGEMMTGEHRQRSWHDR